ncbi:MAG: MBL fold metallo-hydrolase [Nanoarchaeota archaeon]|nr:MBL fold metallo-hydrolase [Nanoarchaeota archaeon]
MKVKFLGTAGYFPTEHRHTSCVILPEEGIVLDAGTGFFRAKGVFKTKELNILLSHYHPDHIFGLTFMLGVLYDQNPDVTIHGPKGIKGLEKKLNFPIKFKDHPFKISLKKIEKEFMLGDVLVKTKFFPHKDELTTAYRLEKNGKSLCYLTDLVASDDEISFIKNCDLLIHECYFNTDYKELAEKTSHSYTTQVAEVARKAGVKLLMLYHVSPLLEEENLSSYVGECKNIFKDTFLPKDNQEVVI